MLGLQVDDKERAWELEGLHVAAGGGVAGAGEAAGGGVAPSGEAAGGGVARSGEAAGGGVPRSGKAAGAEGEGVLGGSRRREAGRPGKQPTAGIGPGRQRG